MPILGKNGIYKLFTRFLLYRITDELIRQECAINVDRGELLIRIRNEFIAIILAYKQLFENCLMFSTREATIVSYC